jgi:hypothetical protein
VINIPAGRLAYLSPDNKKEFFLGDVLEDSTSDNGYVVILTPIFPREDNDYATCARIKCLKSGLDFYSYDGERIAR